MEDEFEVEGNLVLCSNCGGEFNADEQGHIWHGSESNHGLFNLTDKEFDKLTKRWASEGKGFCCVECECNYYRGVK